MNENMIFSVSQVNEHMKDLVEGDQLLSGLCVRGELSNYKVYPSGHHYFTMKDAGGALRCVMFKSSAIRLRFQPENGMKVLATGRISVYPRDGAYQLYCTGLIPDGVGDLYLAFAQMKDKLEKEGLFDPSYKKPIPKFPERIAIITSSAGAAVHDMLRILRKRYPLSKILLLPVRVQGVEAPAEICGAIRYANRWKIADVIITGRGGGSLEDLWAFNDENVARAIYASGIPVISAVGHEPDVTISDYVADLRAATPSNAAELAVPDQTELRKRLSAMESSMTAMLSRQVKLSRQRLNALAASRCMQSPTGYLDERRLQLDSLQNRLIAAETQRIARKKQQYVHYAAALDAMSPLKVLTRGYSVAQTETGEILRSVSQVRKADSLTIRLQDGLIQSVVESVSGLKKKEISHE